MRFKDVRVDGNRYTCVCGSSVERIRPLSAVISTAMALCILLRCESLATAAEGGSRRDTIEGNVLADFGVGRDGRPLIIPASIQGKSIRMLVDTGATKTGFDLSLRADLGKPLGRVTLDSSGGSVETPSFAWPKMSIGGIDVRSDEAIFCSDLRGLRAASGEEFDAVLGMDFLRNYIVEIDFDRGRLSLLKRVPEALRRDGAVARIPISVSSCPEVDAPCGAELLRFALDTGANSTCVEGSAFDNLVAQKQMNAGGEFLSMTPAGQIRSRFGCLTDLSLGPFELQHVGCSRDRKSILGLRSLSRFVVLFDFPGKAMYLSKGRRYGLRDPMGTSGVAVMKIEGRMVVKAVNGGGPAEKAGLRPGDELVNIGDQNVDRLDFFELGRLFTAEPGTNLVVDFVRGGKATQTSWVIKSRLR